MVAKKKTRTVSVIKRKPAEDILRQQYGRQVAPDFVDVLEQHVQALIHRAGKVPGVKRVDGEVAHYVCGE